MRSHESDRSRQRLRTILTIVVTALLVAPAAAIASHGFNDVDSGDFFHEAVDWMKDNGVTVGCNPSGGNTKYCPDDPVTRGEMAVFLQRLDTKNVFLRPGEKATDSDKLDGLDGTYYANPIAIATGSFFDGTHITSDGEVARLTLSAPAAGDVIAHHSSSWDTDNDYTVVMWIEPHNSGSECNSRIDGDALPGTWSLTSVYAGELATYSSASMAATGADAGVSKGTHVYSLCLNTFQGTNDNIDWSGSVEWRAAGTSTAAMTIEAAESAPPRSTEGTVLGED